MRRSVPTLTVLALGAAVAPALPLRAQDAPITQPLPLRDVALFSSGVGYFHRAGRINGDAAIDLTFRPEQVNDILKSMVLLDPKGSIRPVTYATQSPVLRGLGPGGRPIDGSLSLGSLLRGFQGAQVRLNTGGPERDGRIVSVSLKTLPGGAPGTAPVTAEILNVLGTDGLSAIPLDTVLRIKLLDDRLDRELRSSLEALATGLNDQRRPVSLRFAGAGERDVQAAYLQEMPVWKTSYRLVLDDKGKPYLQGWGHVENTTDEDWKDVRLSLISGRPVSFIQDLYQPLYVPRPVVQAQVIGSPTPQTYGETLEKAEGLIARKPRITGLAGGMGGMGGGAFGAQAAPGAPGPAGPAGAPPALGLRMRSMGRSERDADAKALADAPEMNMQMASTVAAQAEGSERGELFEYAIKTPVTLPRGQAAMVPIVGTGIEGDRVSIFDVDADTKHALNGFRLKNTTGLHLSGGPITVFQNDAYAGDAQITNLQPGEERLISYAVDLELVADREEPKFNQNTVTISAKSGVMTIIRRQQREQVYTFRNKGKEAKTVLVQQNIEPEFKLTEPAKPTEKTPEEYRFLVTVPAEKTASLKVVSERPVSEEIALFDVDLNVLIQYAQNGQVSQKLRAALNDLVAKRRAIADLQAQRATREEEIKNIDAEQARIRQNMAQLDRNSPLYQQYVTKLTAQETRIEKLREEGATLRDREAEAQRALRTYVDGLDIA